jgi:hypothetical protein
VGCLQITYFFLDDLKNAGLIPIEFLADITDAEILAYWKK